MSREKMETICQLCGDEGFENAFVYCVNCLNFAVHRYCLPIIPTTFNEFVHWVCEDCKPESLEQFPLKPFSVPSKKKDRVIPKGIPEKHAISELKKGDIPGTVPRIITKKKKGVTCVEEARINNQSDLQAILRRKRADVTSSGAEPDQHKCQRGFSNEIREAEANQEPTSNLGNSPLNDSRTIYLHSEDHENNRNLGVGGSSNIFKDNYCLHAQPVIDPIWRGSFNIRNSDYGLSEGVVAHLSSKACPRVCEEAGFLPASLCLEMLPKASVWPKSFQISEPTDEHIALYFFPENKSYEKVFDRLVSAMIDRELAMRAMVKNAELLVFTSNELPLLYWKFRGKSYLWGVFRGKQASSNHPADQDPVVQNKSNESAGHSDSANDVEAAEDRGLTKNKIQDAQSPLSPLSNSNSSG